MKLFVCKICGHVAFDQAPIGCPVCKVSIENFQNDPEAIKMPEDPNNLTEFEKRHIPSVTIEKKCGLFPGNDCRDIHIKIGETEHAMESEHFISFIDTYINKRHLARFSLTYKKLHPAITIHLKIRDGVLVVVSNCILHGHWMSELDI